MIELYYSEHSGITYVYLVDHEKRSREMLGDIYRDCSGWSFSTRPDLPIKDSWRPTYEWAKRAQARLIRKAFS